MKRQLFILDDVGNITPLSHVAMNHAEASAYLEEHKDEGVISCEDMTSSLQRLVFFGDFDMTDPDKIVVHSIDEVHPWDGKTDPEDMEALQRTTGAWITPSNCSDPIESVENCHWYFLDKWGHPVVLDQHLRIVVGFNYVDEMKTHYPDSKPVKKLESDFAWYIPTE